MGGAGGRGRAVEVGVVVVVGFVVMFNEIEVSSLSRSQEEVWNWSVIEGRRASFEWLMLRTSGRSSGECGRGRSKPLKDQREMQERREGREEKKGDQGNSSASSCQAHFRKKNLARKPRPSDRSVQAVEPRQVKEPFNHFASLVRGGQSRWLQQG